MTTDSQTLERLSNLELCQYAGDLGAIQEEDRGLYEKLTESPVEVVVTGGSGVCDDWLYEICLGVEGQYDTFLEVRKIVQDELRGVVGGPGWNLLTVSFNGIYVGEPEDLLNYRNGRTKSILYQTTGIGKKVADITFLNGDL